MINKDTLLYGSFSNAPGNNGCMFFNNAFKKYNIDAIYKSFYSDDIKETIQAVKHLQFSGFALSSPLKVTVLDYLNEIDPIASEIGACNTVVVEGSKLTGYNTDWIGVYDYFKDKDYKHVSIIGYGGFAKSIIYVFKKLGITYDVYFGNDILHIDKKENETIINATPLEIKSEKNNIIDPRPFTVIGKMIALTQAKEQFKIYTGIQYEN